MVKIRVIDNGEKKCSCNGELVFETNRHTCVNCGKEYLIKSLWLPSNLKEAMKDYSLY